MKILENVNVWSFWQRGWICVPTYLGDFNDDQEAFNNDVGKQATKRFSALPHLYQRFRRNKETSCTVYKVTKIIGASDFTLCYHDMRLPPSEDDHGLIMTPIGDVITKESDPTRRFLSTWERVDATLKHLVYVVRKSLFGTIYVPLLVNNEQSDKDEVLKLMQEVIGDASDFVVLTSLIDDYHAPQKTQNESVNISTDDIKLNNVVVETSDEEQGNDAVDEQPTTSGSSIADEYDTVTPRQPRRRKR